MRHNWRGNFCQHHQLREKDRDLLHGDALHGGPEHSHAQHGHTKVSHLATCSTVGVDTMSVLRMQPGDGENENAHHSGI